MKKVFGIFLAVVLLPASQAQAWIGGPFSNNSYFQNGDDGIYEAFATVQNGVGMFRFAVRNNGNSGETGVNGFDSSNVQFNGGLLAAASSHVWYYRGVTYVGTCIGTANSSFGIVSAISNATAGGEGNTTATNTSSSNNLSFVQNVGGTGNIGFANSSWVAKIRDKFPIVRFSGSGSVTFLGTVNDFSDIVIDPLAEARERAAANAATNAANGGVPPLLETDVSVLLTQILETSSNTLRFRVFGSRVSTIVSLAAGA